eukprot:gene20198-26219_t
MKKEIRELVDRESNCEDIAMQFLISNTTNLPPIYVKGHLDDLGALNVMSHIIVDKASSWWYNTPSTWYEYISSDLWNFFNY